MAKRVLTAALLALVIPCLNSRGDLEGALQILTPETLAGPNPATGLPWKPGDEYRFVFHTSESTNAFSADIDTYNTWVQELANASTNLAIGTEEGAVWKALASTPGIDARDNTGTNPYQDGSGHAVFLLDGSTIVATNYLDLWDGEIEHIIDVTEQGTTWAYWPYTGSFPDGTKSILGGGNHSPLGGANQIQQGNAGSVSDWIWRIWTADPPGTLLPLYAISEPLMIPYWQGCTIILR